MSKGFEVIKNTALLFVYNMEETVRQIPRKRETLTNKKNTTPLFLLAFSLSLSISRRDIGADKFVRKIGEQNIAWS